MATVGEPSADSSRCLCQDRFHFRCRCAGPSVAMPALLTTAVAFVGFPGAFRDGGLSSFSDLRRRAASSGVSCCLAICSAFFACSSRITRTFSACSFDKP